MLRKFVYLDETTLVDYTATLDGGLIAETKTRTAKKGSKGGKLSFKVAERTLGSDDETEQTSGMSDRPEAQFERLLDAADAEPDAIGWINVMEPDANFERLSKGM
jgi:hypothetical protein